MAQPGLHLVRTPPIPATAFRLGHPPQPQPVPSRCRPQEIARYLSKQNQYGLPLDSRVTYTKLDWIVWSATTAEKRADFEALVEPVHRFLHVSPSRVPMTDWYWTDKGTQRGFQARSVVGGVYSKLLADMWKSR